MITKTMAKILHKLPKGFVSYISKKIVNRYLNKYATIHIENEDDLKVIKKPTIFVCNHLSNSDGLVLDKVLKSVNPTFVAGEKLSDNAVTNIGISIVKTTTIKPNFADNEGLKKIIQLVKEGESIVIFPEGTRSREGSLIKAKKGIVLIAKLTGAPIVPIGLYGSEVLLPINKEGDMSSETFQAADVYVKIGKQFDLPKRTKDQDKKDYEEVASRMIMIKIAQLLPEKYRGVYSNL